MTAPLQNPIPADPGSGPSLDGKRHLRVLSNSEIRTFRRCMREWLFAYVMLRRVLSKSDALRFGTLLHVALEAWWLAAKAGLDAGERLALAIDALRAHAGPTKTDPFDLVKAEELMLGYTARWGLEVFEVVAVEVQLSAPLVNPKTDARSKTFTLGMKLDVIVKDARGLAVMEHKSTSEELEPGARYWLRVSALDSQVSTYLSGAKVAGFDVERCIYDVVRKPGIRPLKATPEESRKYTKDRRLYANQRETDETAEEFRTRLREDIQEKPERYFGRGDIVRLDDDNDAHALDVWQTARLMREAELEKRFPRNPDACVRYGRDCEYLPVCAREASIDDDAIYRTAETPHEELGVEEVRT